MGIGRIRSVVGSCGVPTSAAESSSVYGAGTRQQSRYHGLLPGALQPHGEIRLLIAAAGQLMSLRHNSFFTYVVQRVIEKYR
jgi:hypothetical protein